ncbi:MAG TPA: autotransporter-associated beta strand repeat-containing protein [Frateuria sp.]|uniref:autotransporter-associated beta strand repeat-containing protein n=1 Tax=Frateuria sp. TaxID=2211372 RepID=UPI002D80223D|nr:autotransporter-associated beta strand repeat-containing protein [Frateuria sp.]HET6806959.1 autotransporter-associated beta strand repeat-containing protein [Frateuria sp.]
MNKIFRIVWNRALRQFMVASELARSPRSGCAVDARRASAPSSALRRGALALALAAVIPLSQAHTVSVGYTNNGSGALTFWYGTYHDPSEASYHEGQFHLTGPSGYDQLVDFTLLVSTKPAELEDGYNNFYSSPDQTGLVDTNNIQTVLTWQGVSFSGLTAGTYVYSYVPIANPTQVWDPYAPVLTNTLTITAADLNGYPLEGGNTYDETTPQLNQSDSIVFNGGIFAPTEDTTRNQQVTLRSGGGTVDTSGGDVVFTGGVDGSGTLTKTGEGTLTLDGTSTYAGGTVVEQGTLKGDTDSLQGGITNDGTVSFDQSTDGTYAGNMDGTGSLVKEGNGTLVLTGDNIYTGGTTINGGTLQGDTRSLQGDIANKATVDFNQSADGTYAGDLSGTGNLVKDGIGTLLLTGSNSYTGGTTINGGTLQGDASSLHGDIHNNGTLDFVQATDASYTGVISGTGGLVKDGSGTLTITGNASHHGGTTVNDGTLVLTGANTYTGGTTLNGGTLQVASDASLGDAAGTITFNGGDLTVTHSMESNRDMVINAGNASITTLAGVTLTANGDMGGSGGLVKRGDGTLVVRGNNTFTGGTLVDGGVIKIDSGSSLGTGVIVLQGGMLQTVQTLGTGQTVLVSGNSGVDTDAGTTTELSGQILTTGNVGCFVKSGKGTLNMTGAATLTNGTCVQDGMLRANGELTSWVQVDRPATVRGVGLIQGSVNVEGTLAPGNSPGTLSVADAVTMNDGSTLQIDIDGKGTGTGKGNYSRLLVGGTFTADGTLAPIVRGITGNASNTFTPELGDVYTVVEADGGVQGRFAALQQPTAGLAANTRFQVFYVGGHAVQLFVTPTSYASLSGGHANGNAVRAGEAVDRMVAAQDAGTDTTDQHELLFALAGLRAAALPQVMQGLAGEAHAQTAAMAREASLGLAGDMADHLAEASLDQGRHGSRAWVTLSQGGYRGLSDAQASGFHSQQSRTSVGLDAYRGDVVLWGVGLAHTESRLENIPASGNVRGNGALLYAELAAGPALVDGTASWSKDQWRTRRADPLAPASSLASQADGQNMAASVTARFPLQHEGLRIEPYVQAVWQRVNREGFVETGEATTRLDVGRYDETGTRLLAGMKLGSTAQDPLASSVTWRLGAAVGQDFGATLNPVVDASLAGESFAVRTPSMGRTLLKLDASGTMRLGKQAYLYGGVNSATGHDRAGYGVNAGVRVQF